MIMPVGITIHCSDSDIDSHDDISVIRKWHTENGWKGSDGILGTEDDVGYQWFITSSGSIQAGRSESSLGAHARGHNNTIGICFSGRNKFSEHQILMGIQLIKRIIEEYGFKREDIKPHNYYDKNKTCPNFDIDKRILDKIF